MLKGGSQEQCVKNPCFFSTGLEDEGFEMLEQLAYLYLANNKVSHTAGV